MKNHSRLIRLRGIRERQARVGLGQANQAKASADDELSRRRQEHEAALDSQDGEDAGALHSSHLAQTATLESRQAAEAKQFQADLETRAARGAWQRSLQDLEMAEKLEERRRLDLAQVARMTSERALDELMTLRRRRR